MFIFINCVLWMFRVTTIYPIQNQKALQDRRVMSLIQYAKKKEKNFFEVAQSRVSPFAWDICFSSRGCHSF